MGEIKIKRSSLLAQLIYRSILGGLIGLLAYILVALILIGFIYWTVDKLVKVDGKTKFENKINEEEMTDIIHLLKKINKNINHLVKDN